MNIFSTTFFFFDRLTEDAHERKNNDLYSDQMSNILFNWLFIEFGG